MEEHFILQETQGGTSSILNSIVSGNEAAREGGGLWNQSGNIMTVGTSTIDNNSSFGPAADDGGAGIFNNGGTVNVIGSTVSNNSSNGTASNGGGIHNAGGAVVVRTSTISGNSSAGGGGGIANASGSTLINAVTIANNTAGSNGGGVLGIANTILKNSIVALNDASSGMDISGSFTSNDYNLIGTDDEDVFPEGTNDIEEVDPMLGPLQDNGGTTLTHMLLEGSQAYNGGDPADQFVDQIGQDVFEGVRDIGAFESQEVILGIEETADGGFNIKVYPNPSKGVSNISIPVTFGNRITLSVIEAGSGKIVRNEVITSGINEVRFDAMQNGVYILRLNSEENTSTHRLIISK